MRFGWQRLVILLVFSVAVLQILHMSMLNRMIDVDQRQNSNEPMTSRTMRSSRPNRQDTGFRPDVMPADQEPRRWRSIAAVDGDMQRLKKELMAMADEIRRSSVLDSSGEYKIVNDLMQQALHVLDIGSVNIGVEDVTLVTQCSGDQLAHLTTMTKYWNGPMSVAVFVTGNNLVSTLMAISRFRQCNSNSSHNVLFHLVYPLRDDGLGLLDSIHDLNSSAWTCEGPSTIRPSAVNYELNDGNRVPYPNNLLRNVARQNVRNEFVFVVDVDMVPSKNLRRQFVRFARANDLFSEASRHMSDKTAYVVPAYELRLESRTMDVPENKRQLLDAIAESRARPFYVEVCTKCQKQTDYAAWESAQPDPNEREDLLDVLFDVLWKDPWEPFYVARNTVPAYDERFKQYGFNRISQVCEMQVAGYKFSVLNNAFLMHKGLKTLESFHTRKDVDQERNRLLFRQFKQELKEKYPDSSRRCY